MDFLLLHEFRKCVDRYDGDERGRSFSCLDQFLTMAFAQLTWRESLRDIEAWEKFFVVPISESIWIRIGASVLYPPGFAADSRSRL